MTRCRASVWPAKLAASAMLLALLAVACQKPPSTPPPPVSGGDVCEDLAYVFFLVARNKDQGRSKAEQLEMAREGIANPFAGNPGRTLRYWSQVIEFVYRRPDASADEVREEVRRSCTVDPRGQAVLLWPRE